MAAGLVWLVLLAVARDAAHRSFCFLFLPLKFLISMNDSCKLEGVTSLSGRTHDRERRKAADRRECALGRGRFSPLFVKERGAKQNIFFSLPNEGKRNSRPFRERARLLSLSLLLLLLPPLHRGMLASTGRRLAAGLFATGGNGSLLNGALVAAADSILFSSPSSSMSIKPSSSLSSRSLSTDTDIRKVLADKIPEQQVRECTGRDLSSKR